MSSINGTAGSDNLPGGTASDQILGFQGDDTIQGNGGNDTIFAGKGRDEIFFGIGNGTSFDEPGANGSSSVIGGEGADTITSEGGLGNNTVLGGTGIPSIDSGADQGDFLNLSEDQGRDLILGNYGDDQIIVGAGGATAFGGMGNDVIYDTGSTLYENGPLAGGAGGVEPPAGSANDVIFGGEGGDTIDLSAYGNSTVVGGTGNPAVDVTADGADLILLDQTATDGSGNPLVANDLILGNFGDDTITASGLVFSNLQSGGVPDNVSNGQALGGTDTLAGGNGNDAIISGQQSNDIILGNEANDFIVAVASQQGTDTIYGGQGDDTIAAGNIQAFGAAADGVNELVFGGEANDIIFIRGTGNDTLYGGIDSTGGSADGANAFDIEGQDTGRDRIYGGPNGDYVLVGQTDAAATVTGGTGADTVSFVQELGFGSFNGDGGSAFNGTGNDVITDFQSGTDKINNPDAVQSTLVVGTPITGTPDLQTAATQALTAGAAVNPGGVNAVLFQTQAGGDHYLAIDNVNDGGASGTYDVGVDLLIDLKTTTTITGADFLSAPNNVLFPNI